MRDYIGFVIIWGYFLILKTPTAIHRRPMFFSTLRRKLQEEMSATFLATLLELRGRNCGLFIHLGQQGEEGKPEKSRQDFSGTFLAGQRNQKIHAKNNYKKTGKYAKMTPKSAKKRHLGCPWAPPGLHKREEAVQTHFGSLFWSILAPFWAPLGTPWASPGRPRRSKNTPRSGKRRVQERSKKNS